LTACQRLSSRAHKIAAPADFPTTGKSFQFSLRAASWFARKAENRCAKPRFSRTISIRFAPPAPPSQEFNFRFSEKYVCLPHPDSPEGRF
jgi:hypothetical protein